MSSVRKDRMRDDHDCGVSPRQDHCLNKDTFKQRALITSKV